jgi:PIN domain nuclease of toxin-antitoxin system
VTVLDAYAVIAYLRGEPCAGEVSDLLRGPAIVTSVNAAEVCDQMVRVFGADADGMEADLALLCHAGLTVQAVTHELGMQAGRIRARRAIRYHLREHWDEDPEHYDRLSERLEQIIEELGEQWEQLALALGDLLPEVRAGRQADDSGLNPVTEAPFYDLLRRELADEGRTLSAPGEALLRDLTMDLVSHIRAEIGLVGFWHNTYAQNALRAWVATRLAEPMIDGADLFDFTRTSPVASRLVELAKANHARLVNS